MDTQNRYFFRTEKDASVDELIELIEKTPNVKYSEEYISPIEVAGTDYTYVSRLRKPEEKKLFFDVGDC